MIWRDPIYFYLGFMLAALAFYLIVWSPKKRPSIQFSGIQVFAGINPGWRARLAALPKILKQVGLVLMILALARPQSATTKTKRNVEGIDIMITLDISDSMLIEDMKPENRMVVAKQMIKEFIEGRVSDRIGLVIFSGESYTRVPPTLDYKMLLQNLSEVQTQRNLKMGTAIGVALANATARLRDSTAKSRVVILMTDGENNSGMVAPEVALDIAKGYGIKIYSIGIGRDGDAQLPVYSTDIMGRTRKTYQPIHSSVNDQLLGKMADDTGGKYYRATTSQALENVFKDIDRLEKTKVEVNQYTRYTELFDRYLAWAALLYGLGVALGQILLRRAP